MKKKRIIIILLCIILFIWIGVSFIKIIEHENGSGSKAEKIVDDVISRQSLKVDAASGATVSSKCIIKAVENALQYGSK